MDGERETDLKEITRNRLFKWYAKTIWPIHRMFVRCISKRCKSCIVSESCEPLDEDGYCSACKTPTVKKTVSNDFRDEFKNRMAYYIGKSTVKYHAVMMLSGGKDSAYVLHKIKKEFPFLNILCVTVDNGFTSQISLDNASFLTKKMGVDWVIIRSYFNDFRNAFRNAFIKLKSGKKAYEVVDFADGEKIFTVAHEFAKDIGVPVVICGLSAMQMQMIPKHCHFEIVRPDQPSTIAPLVVWETGEEEILSEVRNLDLVPKGKDDPLLTNNSMISTMCIVDIMNNGYCSFETEFANSVREGKSNRKFWLYVYELLEYATKKGWLTKDVKKSLSYLDLTIGDVSIEK